MAAAGQWQPPWLGCIFSLASAYLIACQKSPDPKTTQKAATVPSHISTNNSWMGMLEVAILCACTVGKRMCHMNK